MSDPFLGEIKVVSFPFAPRGWALCNGQLLPINQNQALFALLGNMYGGNGVTTFALPDLRGRAPLHRGQRPGGSAFVQGAHGGAPSHTLTVAEMPTHRHRAHAHADPATHPGPTGRLPATTAEPAYRVPPAATMHTASVDPVGGSQPHQNEPPYLAVSFIIALQGIFPSRS